MRTWLMCAMFLAIASASACSRAGAATPEEAARTWVRAVAAQDVAEAPRVAFRPLSSKTVEKEHSVLIGSTQPMKVGAVQLEDTPCTQPLSSSGEVPRSEARSYLVVSFVADGRKMEPPRGEYALILKRVSGKWVVRGTIGGGASPATF